MIRVTPDGVRYLATGRGNAQPMPFHLRWLLPAMLGDSALAWIVTTRLSIAACGLLVGVWAFQRGGTNAQVVMAALLWLGLPSVRFLARAPVLVDAPGMALTLGAVVAWPTFPWLSALFLVLASCVWEKAPIFAAAFAWQPFLLLALFVPLTRRVFVTPGVIAEDDPLADTLRHPLATGVRTHAGVWRDPVAMLLPWGACLAALAALDLRWLVPAALSYSQLAFATDSVRLYQSAAPAVCIAAAFVIPQEWFVPVMVARWFNPWAGNGV